MRYAIHTQHCDFFNERNAVEFEGVLNETELASLNTALKNALAERLSVKPEDMERKIPRVLYAAGRDLWRVNSSVKKIVCGTKLAQIAFDLVQVKPLRLVFDQYIPNGAFLNHDRPFEDQCCIQGFVCGVLLMLSGDKAGSALYFSPSYVFPEGEKNKMLLIGYAHALSLYVHQERDPQLHDLKKLGYNFGDRLNDKLHPLIHNLQG
jgi:hypothetical protein